MSSPEYLDELQFDFGNINKIAPLVRVAAAELIAETRGILVDGSSLPFVILANTAASENDGYIIPLRQQKIFYIHPQEIVSQVNEFIKACGGMEGIQQEIIDKELNISVSQRLLDILVKIGINNIVGGALLPFPNLKKIYEADIDCQTEFFFRVKDLIDEQGIDIFNL